MAESDDDVMFDRFPDLPSTTSPSNSSAQVVTLKAIVLKVSIKYDRDERVKALIDELLRPNGEQKSTLELYVRRSTSTPIEMGHQSSTHRPDLFIRKNDAFGPWTHNHLLTLLSFEYLHEPTFPAIWKTDASTAVRFAPVGKYESTSAGQSTTSDDEQDLKGLFRTICRQNQRKDTVADDWATEFEKESIFTIAHLRTAVANERIWDNIPIKLIVKQIIKDHVQLSTPSLVKDPLAPDYDNSDATLYADIHRLRRYFHHVAGTLKFISYLHPEAVRLAIIETRKTYDDDGNILKTIEAYLRTFCLQHREPDSDAHKQKLIGWKEEKTRLKEENRTLTGDAGILEAQAKGAASRVEMEKTTMQTAEQEHQRAVEKAEKLLKESTTIDRSKQSYEWTRKRNEAERTKKKAEQDLKKARDRLEEVEADLVLKLAPVRDKRQKIAENNAKIHDLDSYINFDIEAAQKKLRVKYGRGLLLYGPPGTGKSELLKRVATFAGITMITTPLAAGELNRPYVGETERLLVDIMHRACTIPYLICAMTIDEIDGLVPKRTNSAQQSKVDGISVLLSHIEGVKNIENLIVLGATNRRQMMDEAFLRRMQAKCFVGRPSPAIRRTMLEPLISLNTTIFNNQRLNFLVQITTNFSGAAVMALKSSIIVAMETIKTDTVDERIFLDLANNAAREFSCWFGIGTLPEICRLYPNIFSSENEAEREKYSLKMSDSFPTGRIVVDLDTRKCLIEMENQPTLEEELDDKETSTNTLLARFLQGCASRNIDTIQVIDLNYLIKNNAFEENQIFELLTTIFEECDEYNRSMLIFDIDSLIAVSVNDSAMSKSQSISNIRLYQFIREKCKKGVVEQKGEAQFLKERWIVMIVKELFLRTSLLKDVDFQKTFRQRQEEYEAEQKRLDSESTKTCPKCHQFYVPAQANHGSCQYHNGFIVDIKKPKTVVEHADAQTCIERARLAVAMNTSMDPTAAREAIPKLVWTCCLTFVADNQPCQTGICGLPEELKDTQFDTDDAMRAAVQAVFESDLQAKQKIEAFARSQGTWDAVPTRRLTVNRPE